MRIKRIAILSALLAALCCSCGGSPSDLPTGAEAALVTINGEELSREEIDFVLGTVIDQYGIYNEIDWNGKIEGVGAREYFLQNALSLAVDAHVTALKATEMGYALTDAEESEIDWNIALEVDYHGGREAFEEAVGAAEELYRFYRYSTPLMYEKLLNGLFGPEGQEALSDQSIKEYYQENFITVSYIFLSATDDYGLRLIGDDLETQEKIAEAIRKQAVSGEDFFELVELYGQDYLMSLSVRGMPVPLGEFGSVFDAALTALKENEISDVISTEEGFYIIMRLPTDWEWYEQNRDNLWYYCGSESLNALISRWSSEMEVVTGAAYYEIDPVELTAVG